MHKGMILLHKTVVVICIFFKCICNLQGRGKKGLRGVIKDSKHADMKSACLLILKDMLNVKRNAGNPLC